MVFRQNQGNQHSKDYKSIYLIVGVIFSCTIAFMYVTAQLCDLFSNFKVFRLSLSKVILCSIESLKEFGSPQSSWARYVNIGTKDNFYLAFVTTLVLFGSIVVAYYKFIQPLNFKKIFDLSSSEKKEINQYSKLASLSDLSDLIVTETKKGRIVFGTSKNKLIAGEPNQSLLVIGPTQSKKTTGFSIPALLEWEGPIVATSVKTDLVRCCYGYRKTQGNVSVIDPSDQFDCDKVYWSPIAASNTFDAAKKMSSYMTHETSSQSGLEDSRFWYQCAGKLLAPMLFAAANFEKDIHDIIRWVETQNTEEVVRLLLKLNEVKAVQAFESALLKEERQRSSIYTTLETVLDSFSCIPDKCNGFSVPEFFNGNNSVFLIASAHEQNRLRDYFTSVIGEILRQAFDRVNITGEPFDPPLLLILDEAANIAPLSNLDTLASTAASHGILLVSVFQDIAQIYTRYGSKASTVINNHRAKIVLSGLSDVDNLDKLSALGGAKINMFNSVTVDQKGSRSYTESPQVLNLITNSSLRQLEPGFGLLIYGHLQPAKIKLRPYFENSKLLNKVQLT